MADPTPLAPQQVSFFHEEGYLIVPDVFDPAALEPLRREIHGEINRKARELHAAGRLPHLHAEAGFDRQLSLIYRDSKEAGDAIVRHLMGVRGGGYYSPEMFGLLVNRQLLAKISSLLGSEEVIASAYRIRPKLPHFGRGVVPWHQDSGYLAEHCDRHLIITCWVPFVDATRENGCMEILPRTHRDRVYQHHAGGNADFLVIEDRDLPVDPRGAITAACPRGGAVFMTNRTPHCSTPNVSDHIRWSVDLRYKAADVPNNVGLEPAHVDAAGRADPDFYEKVNVACYPPDADIVVQSRKHPERVIDYQEYVRLREIYDHTEPRFAEVRAWPALSAAIK
ncbi:MAG TPA: phytanoyl-CoA dioxygenase family protein [Opitutaceae bacterium]|nr:phytanoyl-CoA dioxygenase family protein [Opitutaceae bacterium]HRJ48232.1 phytanoyl-CoA dioxygenase family protein [Opitutaceae bacterium]